MFIKTGKSLNILKSFIKDMKAQVSMEILLVVVGGILIATIIGIFLKTKAAEQANEGNKDVNSLIQAASKSDN